MAKPIYRTYTDEEYCEAKNDNDAVVALIARPAANTVTLDKAAVEEIPFILNRFCEISDHPEEAGKLMDKILDLLEEVDE